MSAEGNSMTNEDIAWFAGRMRKMVDEWELFAVEMPPEVRALGTFAVRVTVETPSGKEHSLIVGTEDPDSEGS